MSTELERTNVEADPSRYWEEGAGQSASAPFRRLVAQERIREAVKGTAQHVGTVLAALTPSNGVIEITLSELRTITGLSSKALIPALRKLADAGLLRIRRRGSVANVYRWMPCTYPICKRSILDTGCDLDRASGEASQPDLPPGAIRRIFLPVYLEVREARYRIPRAVPAWLSDDAWKLLERTFLDIARQEQRADEALEEAAERLVRAGLERWFGRKGRDGFLVRERHKIQHFPKDLEWVASQIAAPPLRDPDRASPESKPAPMPAPDELRRLIAEGAREVASAASGGRRAA